MALNIMVYPESHGWAVKRGDEGQLIVWLRVREEAIAIGRAIAEQEDLLLVVLDHARSEEPGDTAPPR